MNASHLRAIGLTAMFTSALCFALPVQAERGEVRRGAATSVKRPSTLPSDGRGERINNSGNRVSGSGNRVNTGNVRVGNNVNVNVDNDGWRDYDDHYHPIARGAAFGAAAAVTSAAVGSMIYRLPPSCAVRPYSGLTYYYCGSVWYAPQYQGTTVVYVVVNQPY